MLTETEKECVDLAGALYTKIASEIVGHGECRSGDLAEFEYYVHGIQRMLMGQSAVRTTEPHGYFRLLGLSCDETAAALGQL